MTAEFCQIVGLVAAYLDKHPDGAVRLRAFLTDGQAGLWEMEDVEKFTGWGKQHIRLLCRTNRLPHIPSKPTKFIEDDVKKAVEQMQIGGIYGRRKAKLKTQGR
jgi:hypothetical protein